MARPGGPTPLDRETGKSLETCGCHCQSEANMTFDSVTDLSAGWPIFTIDNDCLSIVRDNPQRIGQRRAPSDEIGPALLLKPPSQGPEPALELTNGSEHETI